MKVKLMCQCLLLIFGWNYHQICFQVKIWKGRGRRSETYSSSDINFTRGTKYVQHKRQESSMSHLSFNADSLSLTIVSRTMILIFFHDTPLMEKNIVKYSSSRTWTLMCDVSKKTKCLPSSQASTSQQFIKQTLHHNAPKKKKRRSALGHWPVARLQHQIAADARKDLIRCNNSAFTASETESA